MDFSFINNVTTSHCCLPPAFLDQLRNDPVVFEPNVKDSYIWESQFEKFRWMALRQKDGLYRADVDFPLMFDFGSSHNEPPVEYSTELIDWLKEKEREAASEDEEEARRFVARQLRLAKLYKQLYETDCFGEFTREIRRNYAHLAVRLDDIPLLYECIRLGVSIDWKDKYGLTPLLHAFVKLAYVNLVTEFIIPLKLDVFPPAYADSIVSSPKKVEAKIVRMATILIEQHANINVSAFGYTPFTLAVELRQWSLVELLVRHGAGTPSPSTLELLPDDGARLLAITQTQRPPRPCPCWSGKLLSECHNPTKGYSRVPYPDDFLCPCGRPSFKSFSECCGRGTDVILEYWSTLR